MFHKNDFSSESELDEDAVAAYYAVRIDKSQGMTITAAAAEGRYDDSSSHAVFLKIWPPVFLQADCSCISRSLTSIFVPQVRGLVERVSERSQPSQSPRLGRTGSGQGDSQEGKQ